jgi:membrane peptidoglycan carboxypeptidase
VAAVAVSLQTRRAHAHPRGDGYFFALSQREPSPGRLQRAGALIVALFLVALGAAVTVPVLLPVGLGAKAVADAYNDVVLPDPRPQRLTTYLYDREGNPLTSLHGEVDRTPVPLSEVPRHTQLAVLAFEDADFYEHAGVSPMSIARAAWTNIQQGRIEQGGSTITQQLIKQAYLGRSATTVLQKLEEGILAMKLERELTKEQILERYLNTVYFGHGAYGIYAAAKTYFNKEPHQLKLIESATLAGLIRSPTESDPINHPDAAEFQRDTVLQRMADLGLITQRRASKLGKRPVETNDGTRAWAPAAYFVTHTKRHIQNKYGVDATFEGGLRVRTTLDMRLQQAAERAVSTWLPTGPDHPSGALVAIDPRNGAIRAMVGDSRYLGRSKIGRFNLATQAKRQTGSAFKMFTLAAAMEDRISLNSTWNGPSQIEITAEVCRGIDQETGLEENWKPINAGDSGAGRMTLKSATAYSVNTIFAQVVVQVGPADVAEIAHRMGVRSRLEPVCAITLGSEEVTVLDMATAYATIAARGVRHWPRVVARIDDADGNLVARPRSKGERVLDQNDADLVTYALQGVVTGGTGTRANIGRPVAGKTGSGHDNTNAWFCGFVPQLVTCVWVGYPQGLVPMLDDFYGGPVYGGTIPASIWHDFMAVAVQGLPVIGFPTPSFTGYDGQAEGEFGEPIAAPTPEPTTSPRPEPTRTPPPRATTPPPPPPPPTTPPPPPTTPPPGTPPPPP